MLIRVFLWWWFVSSVGSKHIVCIMVVFKVLEQPCLDWEPVTFKLWTPESRIRRRQIQRNWRRICVWLCSRSLLYNSSQISFPFWGLHYEKIKMTQWVSACSTVTQEYFTSWNALYEGLSLLLFWPSCFISWGWNSSEPSQSSSGACWTLSKPHTSSSRRSERGSAVNSLPV